ncbi:MAG: hypothetical protein V4621_07060 [Pseudomonadota bacterium]
MTTWMSWPLVRYVLMGARHDRIILSIFVAIGLACALSIFLGSAAVVEKPEFAFVYMAASLRNLGAFGLMIFIVFFFRRAMDNRDVDFLLSRPVSRACFLISHVVGFAIIAVAIAALVFGAITIFGWRGWQPGFLLWGGSYAIELLCVMMVSLFFSVMLRSASSATFACLAFYILCRLLGQISGILAHKSDIDISHGVLNGIMQSVMLFLPRLDLLGQTSWLLYGPVAGTPYTFLLVHGCVFMALVFCAMTADFVRRQF